MRSSKPSRRVCPFATICGSKLLLRSRGTAISIAPSSPITVLFIIAVATVATAATGRVAFLVSQMLAQLGAQRAFQQALLEFLEQPFLAEQILRRAVTLQQLLDDLVSDRLRHGP